MSYKKGRTLSYHEHKFLDVAGFNNEHHIVAQSHCGKSTRKNLLVIDAIRHQALHYIFNLLTLQEISIYLLLHKPFTNRKPFGRNAYRLLFGNRTYEEASEFILRIDRAKKNQTNWY